MVCYLLSSNTVLIGLCSEYNHVRNSAGECALVSGAQPLPDDDSCPEDAEFWYERTAYRKIPKSSCEGGERPDHGARRNCPGLRAHNVGFWLTIFFIPFGVTALVAFWYYRRSGYRRGCANYLWSTSPDIDLLLARSAYPIGMPSLIPVLCQLSSRFRGSSWALLALRGAILSSFLSFLDPSSAQGEDTVMYQLMKMRKSCDSMTRIRPHAWAR
jgi:hypothetical protein